MTPREQVIHALERRPPIPGQRVPHFELVFFLTMELVGKVHPQQRCYPQWAQATEKERELHRQDIADLYIECARRLEHSAIFVHPPSGWPDEELAALVRRIRDKSGNEFFLMVYCDPTFALPSGGTLTDFCYRMSDDPDGLKAEASRATDDAIRRLERHFMNIGVDGIGACSDYCFNTGPFMSPDQFSEFVTPYLARLVQACRDMGLYVIKHTDGNIMPIVDQIVATRPHALHSLDPQGGVDIAEIKRRYGGEITLMGNVNCGLLDTGTEEECIASAEYALRHGMPGGGYIFSTSNCIYTGMRLERYELILDVWRSKGIYA